MELDKQILTTIELYAAAELKDMNYSQRMNREMTKKLHAAMLSGMLIMTEYQLKNDGSEKVTPQVINAAVGRVGRLIGLSMDKLKP